MGALENLSKGKSHSCKKITNQDWEISWYYDYYPKNVSWRATKKITRTTDKKGAERFCKKWGITPHPHY